MNEYRFKIDLIKPELMGVRQSIWRLEDTNFTMIICGMRNSILWIEKFYGAGL